jgi:uncharacterized protein YecE (DUF72 family)
MPELYIGTSGFSYPHWENGVFYPKDLPRTKELEYYSKHFSSVELNAPFYRLPTTKTFLNWKNRVPKNFVFAVKVSRFITHIKKLKGVKSAWQTFFKRALCLENKLGPFLFQFPPIFSATEENTIRLGKFLEYISVDSHNIREYSRIRFAFEFRHPSWFSKEVIEIFKKYKNATICLADSPRWPFKEIICRTPRSGVRRSKNFLLLTPQLKLRREMRRSLIEAGNFVYIRMHGGKVLYSSNYSEEELKGWAAKIKKYLKENLDAYIYFNNDAQGFAPKNAQRLLELINQSR